VGFVINEYEYITDLESSSSIENNYNKTKLLNMNPLSTLRATYLDGICSDICIELYLSISTDT